VYGRVSASHTPDDSSRGSPTPIPATTGTQTLGVYVGGGFLGGAPATSLAVLYFFLLSFSGIPAGPQGQTRHDPAGSIMALRARIKSIYTASVVAG